MPEAGSEIEMPTVLVVEDDPASGEFFRCALKQMHCEAQLCIRGQQALDETQRTRFDLLLVDRHLPDMDAAQLLTTLRSDPQAASRFRPALATSAEVDPALRTTLLHAGYAGVLGKPLSYSTLRSHVARVASSARFAATLLDDTVAREQSLSMDSVTKLRRRFAADLRQFLNDLESTPGEPPDMGDRLHRLKAACGFCGATALAETAATLKRVVDTGASLEDVQIDQLRRVMTDTLLALPAADAS